MSNPTESMLAEMRQCLHASIPCNDKSLKPDYKCAFTGNPCFLFKEPFCERREQFPESMMDT